jgi:hypothetical protein
VEGLGGEVEGGWRAHGVKKACNGAKREEGVPLHPFSGRRHVREERDGGPVGARPRGGGGRLATMRARAGGPDTSGVRSGGGSPRTAALGHTRGRQGKREKGEKAGAPMSGPARRVEPSCREREKMGGRKRG